ncbi:MAG: molybdopterin molybdotransferase MoeA [Clostridia bacterium]|nr:molybdopterin molybdotransferase MoeA [Clostridia bacterium]
MLNVISFEQAKKIIDEICDTSFATKTVSLEEALGKISACRITSSENIPSFDRSTVDGFAVRASDTFGAGESIPSMLTIKKEILMGENETLEIFPGECAAVSTGGMLPKGADAVVMVEHTQTQLDELCLVFKAVSPFENMTKLGDDLSVDEVIVNENTKLEPFHIGSLAAAGIKNIKVYEKIKVGIISTGDEIVEIDIVPKPGQVRDVNSYLLKAMFEKYGFEADCLGIIKDERKNIKFAIEKAVKNYDMVVISGGSSAGVRDMTEGIISELGKTFVHGIAMKPGKPTIIGKIGKTPIFGLPGHPLAAFFVVQTLILPTLLKKQNASKSFCTENCILDANVSSNHGREEFLCVKIIDEKAVPVYGKSGIISLLSNSDGYIKIDRNTEGIKKGKTVKVFLF